MLIKCRSSINRGVDQRYRGSIIGKPNEVIDWGVDRGTMESRSRVSIEGSDMILQNYVIIVHMILIALGMSIVNNNLSLCVCSMDKL